MMTTAMQLISGSRRLDEMWEEIKQIIRIIISNADLIVDHKRLQIESKQGRRWVIQVVDRMLDRRKVLIEFYYKDGQHPTLRAVGNELERPGAMWLADVHESLDELVDGIFSSYPELAKRLAPIVAAGS
jgi:hypothetical protein